MSCLATFKQSRWIDARSSAKTHTWVRPSPGILAQSLDKQGMTHVPNAAIMFQSRGTFRFNFAEHMFWKLVSQSLAWHSRVGGRLPVQCPILRRPIHPPASLNIEPCIHMAALFSRTLRAGKLQFRFFHCVPFFRSFAFTLCERYLHFI